MRIRNYVHVSNSPAGRSVYGASKLSLYGHATINIDNLTTEKKQLIA